MRFISLYFSIHLVLGISALAITTPEINGSIYDHKNIPIGAKVKRATLKWECYDNAEPSVVLAARSLVSKVKDGTFRFPATEWKCSGNSHRFSVYFRVSGGAALVVVEFLNSLRYGTDTTIYRPIDLIASELTNISFEFLPFSRVGFTLSSGRPLADIEKQLCKNKYKICTSISVYSRVSLIDEAGRTHSNESILLPWGRSRGRFPDPSMFAYFFVAPRGHTSTVEHTMNVIGTFTDKSGNNLGELKSIATVSERFTLPSEDWPSSTRQILIEDHQIPMPEGTDTF